MVYKKNKYFIYLFAIPVAVILMFSSPVMANKSKHTKDLNADITINRQNSDDTGNGLLSFYGMINEAPCHITMASQEQIINIENMAINHSDEKISKDQHFPFNITLDECTPVLSVDDSFYQGNISLLKVRFINHIKSSEQNNSNLNMDIIISNREGRVIPFGVYDYPEINRGDSQDLQFNVSVYNIEQDKQNGGTITFELDYD